MEPRTHRFLPLLAIVVLATVVVFAGACGGSDTTTITADDTTTTMAAEGTGGLEVKGTVDVPSTLTVADIEGMDLVTITAEHPKLGTQEYTGVLLTDLFAVLGVQSVATMLTMAASDGYMAEVALSEISASADALLAVSDDGTLNVVIPGVETKAWVKDVVSMEFK